LNQVTVFEMQRVESINVCRDSNIDAPWNINPDRARRSREK
jgi:hypothetical protein